jgi:hypothetical protein
LDIEYSCVYLAKSVLLQLTLIFYDGYDSCFYPTKAGFRSASTFKIIVATI